MVGVGLVRDDTHELDQRRLGERAVLAVKTREPPHRVDEPRHHATYAAHLVDQHCQRPPRSCEAVSRAVSERIVTCTPSNPSCHAFVQ